MVTVILWIMLVVYLGLVIIKYKKMSNPKIEGTMQLIQGILWFFILAGNWTNSSIILKVAYIIIALLSVIAGIKEFSKCKQ